MANLVGIYIETDGEKRCFDKVILDSDNYSALKCNLYPMGEHLIVDVNSWNREVYLNKGDSLTFTVEG